MSDHYRDDLAYIHDVGYGGIARAAGPVLVDVLRNRGLDRGLVIDLGCGSGILSCAVADAGYEVLGIDISPAMIALAQNRVPEGSFRVGSLLATELPACVAVAAVGEPLNYLFDRDNSAVVLRKLLRRIHRALEPGGLFLGDVAGPGRGLGKGPRRIFAEGDDWAVLVTSEEDQRTQMLTRRIISFRRVGELYRRDEEFHEQRLIPPSHLTDSLRTTGFRVRTLRGYGALPFPPGLTGFLARKV
jgi:SAM-dependent methyltransferase